MGRLSLAAPVACLLVIAVAGCTREDATVSVVRAALGLPAGDFPNYDERVALYATNRARADPSAEGWPAYPAQPPLLWQIDLNHAARAHSQDMHDTPCFQHNSCDGTDSFKRVLGYYTGNWSSIGENILAGKASSDGFLAVHNWINEVGAAPGETGHRDNIFSAKFTLLGNGFVPGGTAFQNYWTQDFIGTPVTHPRLADGVHFPATAAAGGAVTFGTTSRHCRRPPIATRSAADLAARWPRRGRRWDPAMETGSCRPSSPQWRSPSRPPGAAGGGSLSGTAAAPSGAGSRARWSSCERRPASPRRCA